MAKNIKKLNVVSSAFGSNELIPPKYTCKGENISPPLKISAPGISAASFALIVDDPDAPNGNFVHWVVWNIDPNHLVWKEDTVFGTEGINGTGKNGYHGPCPPAGKPHRYFFKVYALDTMLSISEDSSKQDLLEAIEGHVRAEGELIGLFQR